MQSQIFSKVRSVAAGAVLVAATATVPVLAAAAPAQAVADCSYSTLVNGEGAGYVKRSLYLRSGPEAACPELRYVKAGTKVYYHCYEMNQYGNTWFWVRVAGTDAHGWIPDSEVNEIFPYDENGDGETWYRQCGM